MPMHHHLCTAPADHGPNHFVAHNAGSGPIYCDGTATVIDGTTYAAVRTWNRPRSHATVTVYVDGMAVAAVGGSRAARAAAVILSQHTPDAPLRVEARSDAEAAEREAHRKVTATSMMHRGCKLPLTPYEFSVALPVVER